MTGKERELDEAHAKYRAAANAANAANAARVVARAAWDKACREYLASCEAIKAKYAKENTDD